MKRRSFLKKTRRNHKNKYKKIRSLRKRKTIKGGTLPSFERKLIEIQQAENGKSIQIPIRLYNKPVMLTSDNQILQINEKLIFKDFLKNAENMTPSNHTAAVEDLFAWQRENLTQGGICRLYYDDNDTGIDLLLMLKPTLEELYEDNANMDDDEDAMDISFIFRKLPLHPNGPMPVPHQLP
jgi:hypothetical protein